MIRLLVVDDEPRARRGLVRSLDWKKYGIEVVGEAADGIEALRLVEDKDPHIMLTDVRMVRMDGLALLEKAKAISANIQIVMISGYDNFEYVQHALRLGATDYILKPVNERELHAVIEKCVLMIGKEERNRDDPVVAQPDVRNQSVQAAMEYCRQHLDGDLSLSEIAEDIGLHPNYLSRLFKESTGETFMCFLTRLRVEKAKEYLRFTNYKVYEITELVGFRDYRHFSKLFKRNTGQTPLEYRHGG